MPKTTVLLAENHTLVRQGIKALLAEHPDRFEVIGEAENGRVAVSLVDQLRPDVAVLDLSMPQMDGIMATQEIRNVCPETRVIVLTMHVTESFVRGALVAGAQGYLLKDALGSELCLAIEAVAQGKAYLSPAVARIVVDGFVRSLDSGERSVLSLREREVLKLLAEGMKNRTAAEMLHLSEKTVATHRANIMKKLDLHNASELTRYAIREGLVDIG